MNKNTPENPPPTKILHRSLIVFSYLIIMTFFLYLPKLKTFFIEDKALYVYSFPDMINIDVIKDFEKKYGINVSIKYFDTDAELLAKFKITRGEGFDLITASDFMIDMLRKENLLAPLNHEKIPHIKELDERLLNKEFDPNNLYSLPLSWSVYGIIFNKKIFSVKPKNLGLDLIFESQSHVSNIIMPYKMCMVADFREATFLAALYLFGTAKNLNDAKIETIKKLFIQQKKWVECYISQDLRFYLFSEIFHVGITLSSYIRKIIQVRDDFDFIIPKEGSLLSIENIAIPKKSKKHDLIHTLINFLLARKNQTLNTNFYGFNPSNKQAYQDIPQKVLQNPNIFPNDKVFATLHLLQNNSLIKKLNDMWWEVKSS
ncbi:MAG: spermidine/putrescine ABC transporter substrate-binding protein [bacterium]